MSETDLRHRRLLCSHKPCCVERHPNHSELWCIVCLYNDLLQQVSALTAQVEQEQWALSNIYTIARRELQRAPDRLRPEMWAHVSRLCEQVGCQSTGVLRDNGGSVAPPGDPVSPAPQE